MPELTADALFATYFWPHYPPDVRAEPDRFRDLDANPGANPTLLAHLADGAELFAHNAPRVLGTALTLDDAGVHRLARALDRRTRDALMAQSDPADPSNPFFNTLVHAALFVGEAIVRGHVGLWSARRPLWESVVLRPDRHGGGAVPPFHWLLKHVSDAEIDAASLSYRYRVHVELATADVDALDPIVAPRKLPSLKRPSYDLLVKYLHQHLASLRDLGVGFPDPASFTERRYETLGFELMHGGRVLAMHGQAPPHGEAPSTVDVLWLTAAGFDHAESIPCDAQPPYFARTTGDALEVTVAWQGRPHTHRVGFRGHA